MSDTSQTARNYNLILNKDYLIVELKDGSYETESGLYVQESELLIGTVMSAGEGLRTLDNNLIKNPYSVGDVVLLLKTAIESSRAITIPKKYYDDGSLLSDQNAKAYLLTSDFILGKWIKK